MPLEVEELIPLIPAGYTEDMYMIVNAYRYR
jgi:hypothetical protein